jgi:hypothetical protein
VRAYCLGIARHCEERRVPYYDSIEAFEAAAISWMAGGDQWHPPPANRAFNAWLESQAILATLDVTDGSPRLEFPGVADWSGPP